MGSNFNAYSFCVTKLSRTVKHAVASIPYEPTVSRQLLAGKLGRGKKKKKKKARDLNEVKALSFLRERFLRRLRVVIS